MNIFTILFDSLFGFIRRNPITCLVLLIAAVAFPPLFGVVMWVVVALIVISVVSALLLLWRLRSVRKTMEEQIREAAGRNGETFTREEGDISVHRTSEAPAKKINSDIGEYVDFEEEKKDN